MSNDDKRFDVDTFLKNAKRFSIGNVPCAPTAFQTGLAVGAVAGGWRFASTRHFVAAGNMAVFSFVVSGIASFELCRWRHRQQIDATMRELQTRNHNP